MPRPKRETPAGRSPFSIELERQILESGKNFSEIAQAVGGSRGQISRYRTGVNRTITPSLLMKIAKAVSADPKDQARLVKAHMDNHRYDLFPEFIVCEVLDDPKRASKRPKTDEERAVEFLLKKAKGDGRVREVLVALAKSYGAEMAF